MVGIIFSFLQSLISSNKTFTLLVEQRLLKHTRVASLFDYLTHEYKQWLQMGKTITKYTLYKQNIKKN